MRALTSCTCGGADSSLLALHCACAFGSSGPIRYAEYLDYLCAKLPPGEVRRDTLAFDGRNTVLWWPGRQPDGGVAGGGTDGHGRGGAVAEPEQAGDPARELAHEVACLDLES